MGQSGIYRDLPNKFGECRVQFSSVPSEHVRTCMSVGCGRNKADRAVHI